jgi:hypothetical protein
MRTGAYANARTSTGGKRMNIDHSSVNIRQDILQKICGIAEKQHLKTERLINSILEQYLKNEPLARHPSADAEFLLSMAGTVESDEQDTSEHVHDIVRASVEKKYATQSNS